MEEFRSNLMLLLHCRYPQGMLLDKLEEEYEKYYLKRVEPYMFFSEAPSWRNVFEKTYLHNDLKLFEINNTVYVKPVGIRSEAEMALIAKLAKYSHFHYAQDTFFQLRDCTCCQQVYQSFNTLNHYASGTSLSTAQAVAAVSNQYATAPGGQIQQQQQTGDQFRTVQYVAAAPTTIQGTTIQGASSSSTTNLSTTLTMNGGALKYDTRLFEDPNLRAAATGDYYIMLQGTQGNTIQGRYDSLGNLTSPPIQTHRTTETSINQQQQQQQQQQQPQQQQVVYATTPTATAQGTQQWNFSRSTGEVTVATPQPATPTSTPTTNNKSKKGSNQSQSATPKSSKSTPAGKEIHYCRWEGCKKSFRRLKLLENHERAAHVQGSDDGMSCSTVGCDKKFPDKKQLQHHESRCELKPHRCSWEGCDKTFRTSKLLHGHISAVHRKIGRNTYKCSIPGCQQAYPDSTKLRTHEVRCKFRYETLADMKMETDAAEAAAANAALLVTANAVGDVTTVPTVTANVAAAVSSANNLTASSVTSGGATNEDAMNMSMTNSSIEGNKQPASTVDLSFMVKNEVGGEEQCFVPQTHI